MLKKWSVISKPNLLELWVNQLKGGVKYCNSAGQTTKFAPCDFDIDNLNWSGQALRNSVTNALWRLVDKELPPHPTGPEVFKAILMKYRHINASTIRRMEQEITELSIINEPGQNVNTFSEKVLDLAGQIEGGSEHPPHDQSLSVCNTFLSTTEDAFKYEVLIMHNIVKKEPSKI